MHPTFELQPGQHVAYFATSIPAATEIGRVSSTVGRTVFVKYEPELTRHGWDDCTPRATDIRDIGIVRADTYTQMRKAIITPSDEKWWPDGPRDVRPPWERLVNEVVDIANNPEDGSSTVLLLLGLLLLLIWAMYAVSTYVLSY